MSVKTRANNKDITETGDSVTESMFTDLIDSSPNIKDDKIKGAVDTIADLNALTQSDFTDGTYVQVNGYYSRGDGGGGIFFWDSSESQTNHNGGTIIDPDHTQTIGSSAWYSSENSGSGCWKRIIKNNIIASWFGIRYNDSSTSIKLNNTNAFQKIIDLYSGVDDDDSIWIQINGLIHHNGLEIKEGTRIKGSGSSHRYGSGNTKTAGFINKDGHGLYTADSNETKNNIHLYYIYIEAKKASPYKALWLNRAAVFDLKNVVVKDSQDGIYFYGSLIGSVNNCKTDSNVNGLVFRNRETSGIDKDENSKSYTTAVGTNLIQFYTHRANQNTGAGAYIPTGSVNGITFFGGEFEQNTNGTSDSCGVKFEGNSESVSFYATWFERNDYSIRSISVAPKKLKLDSIRSINPNTEGISLDDVNDLYAVNNVITDSSVVISSGDGHYTNNTLNGSSTEDLSGFEGNRYDGAKWRGNAGSVDANEGDIITDGNWNNLDLSSVTPKGQYLLNLRVRISDSSTGRSISFRSGRGTSGFNRSVCESIIANQSLEFDIWVQASNGVIQYLSNGIDICRITVKNWVHTEV